MEGKTNVGEMQGWVNRIRDAYTVRDEFLKVATERQALDFLRENGEFLPYDQQISWLDFKRWQRCAELVIERDILTTASKAILAGTPEKEIDSTGELTQLLRMLTGVYDHTYSVIAQCTHHRHMNWSSFAASRKQRQRRRDKPQNTTRKPLTQSEKGKKRPANVSKNWRGGFMLPRLRPTPFNLFPKSLIQTLSATYNTEAHCLTTS